jgi:hypothetical protein
VVFQMVNMALSRPLSRPWTGIALSSAATSLSLFAAAMSGGGCVKEGGLERGPTAGMAERRAGDEEQDGARGSRSVFDRPVRRLSVEFTVLRYSAPRGTFSSDEAVWKLVSGPLPDAATMLHLADNGFRAAIGRQSDRLGLRAFLGSVGDLGSVLDHARPDVTRHVELDLGPCPPRLVAFHFERGGRLRGLDFVKARAKLQLAFEMRSLNLHEVWLELVPVIEEPAGRPKWVITEEGARQVPQERRCVFADLAIAAKIPEGGFLLLGPTAAVHDRPLVARPFFLEVSKEGANRSAGWRESIYVISPIIRSYERARAEDGAGDLTGAGENRPGVRR